MRRLRVLTTLLALILALSLLASCQRTMSAELEVHGRIATPSEEAFLPMQPGSELGFRSNYSPEEAHPMPMQFFFQHSLGALVDDADAIVLARVMSISPMQKLSFSAQGEGVDERFQYDGQVNTVQAMSVIKGQLSAGYLLDIRTSHALLGSTLDASTLVAIDSRQGPAVLKESGTYLFFLKQMDDQSLYLVNELQGAMEVEESTFALRYESGLVDDGTPLSEVLNGIWTHMAQPMPMQSNNRPFIIGEE